MGAELIIASVIGQVVSGFAAQGAANDQADALRAQAGIERAEGERNAVLAEKKGRIFKSNQALAILKNGIRLSGTALTVLQATEDETNEQAAAERRRGNAQGDLSDANARTAKRKGRAALIGGFASGASSVATFGLLQSRADAGLTGLNRSGQRSFGVLRSDSN